MRPVDRVDVEDVDALPRLRCVRCAARWRCAPRCATSPPRSAKVALDAVACPAARARVGSRRLPSPRRPRPRWARAWTSSARASGSRAGPPSTRWPCRPDRQGRGGAWARTASTSACASSRRARRGDPTSTGSRCTCAARASTRTTRTRAPRSPRPTAPCFSAACATWARRSRARTTRCTRRSSRRSTGRDPLLVEAPVYQLPNSFFDLPACRASAERRSRLTVENNLNHPSVFAWSLVNEPAGSRSELGEFGRGLASYICEAAEAARELDDTRLIAIDRQSRIGEPLDEPGLSLPRRARRERVLRLVRLGAGGPGARRRPPPRSWAPTSTSCTRANPGSR